MKIFPIYLAGVADSDGSFSYNKKFSRQRNKFYYVAQFQLTWKYGDLVKDFFDNLISEYGGSYFDGQTHGSYSATRILKYCATGKDCKKICDDVIPYLKLKRKQAELVSLGASLKSRHWGRGGKPQSVWDRELEIFHDVKDLNTKNEKR